MKYIFWYFFHLLSGRQRWWHSQPRFEEISFNVIYPNMDGMTWSGVVLNIIMSSVPTPGKVFIVIFSFCLSFDVLRYFSIESPIMVTLGRWKAGDFELLVNGSLVVGGLLLSILFRRERSCFSVCVDWQTVVKCLVASLTTESSMFSEAKLLLRGMLACCSWTMLFDWRV